jgi:geranylgeranyl pyrophosphate synthase
MHLFAESMAVMVAGEMEQLFRERGIASREEYYEWISAKTAALFELSTGAAALLGRDGAKSVDTARHFGHEIGMAFQIMDDVLDFTGNPITLGKPVGSDLRQGVVTLPALYYLETHPDDSNLHALITHKQSDEHSLNRLLADIRESGAIQSALAEAQSFVKRGLKALESLPNAPERIVLAEIARAILARNNRLHYSHSA